MPAPRPAAPAIEARKLPRQSRSVATLDAVFEATVQVLLKDGAPNLTTTRVAERAGVSVGTLYQYYPNKQALLYAVLQRHLSRVGDSVETAARAAHGAPLAQMTEQLVQAFLRAKLHRPDEARALYRVAAEQETAALVQAVSQRSLAAVQAMLVTASDVRFADPALTSFMLVSAMVGPMRAVLEGPAPPGLLHALPAQMVSLCLGYLQREALAPAARRPPKRRA